MPETIDGLIQEAAGVLRDAGAREVYVFGSAARGDMQDHSDVDLAVSGLPPQVFFQAMSQASAVLCRPLDLVDLDEDTPFVNYLKEEGDLKLVA